MFKLLEKWALKRLLKKVSKEIPNVELAWNKCYDEIEIKIANSIKKVLIDISRRITDENNNN